MCWSKAGRLFWLRAHGFWDQRLDDLGITPRGKPYDASTRTLSLPPTFFKAVAALTPPNEGEPPAVSAQGRWLAYRRMHALVHNLVTVAALLGRKPVIPQVPCEFVRGVQQRRMSTPSGRSRFGVSHPSVVVTGSKKNPVCHLAPGTWRPGGPDQCYHNFIMAQFDYERFLNSSFVRDTKATRTLHRMQLPDAFPVEPPPSAQSYDKVPIDLDALRKLCEENKRKHADAPLLQLDGLLPIRDLVIDAPVGASEFYTEAKRLKSGKPRWLSTLRSRQLRKLVDVCPGAAKLIEWRKACVGYFLAEFV